MKNKDIENIKWMAKAGKNMIFPIVLLTFLTTLSATTGIVFALFTKDFINAATSHNEKNVYLCLFKIILLVVVYLTVRMFITFLQDYTVSKLEIKYKSYVFEQILKKDYAHISTFHSGDLMNRLIGDVQITANSIATFIPAVGSLITQVVVAMVVIFSIDPTFASVFLVGGLLFFFISRIVKKYTKKLHKQIRDTEGKTRSFLQEAIENILVIKIFSAQESIYQKSQKLQEDNYKIKVKRRILSIITSNGMALIMQAGYIYALSWGVFGILYKTLDYGTLVALIQLVGQVRAPFSGMSDLLSRWFALTASVERLMDICNIENEDAVGDSFSYSETKKLYSKLDSINFNNISFCYDRNTILENTSLKINKGDFVAITGISGIGKSTLLKLLLGVYKCEGEIFFETVNKKKTPANYRTRTMFSYVPQGNMLLSGTIKENIVFMREDITDEDIATAVKLSCADDFIKDFPDGLDTVIGEKGIGLSEGQIQRIAIARALVTKAPVILLDEATSALDEATEDRLLNNLRKLDNMTCIIISHKKAALHICNRHIEIVDKEIIETETV